MISCFNMQQFAALKTRMTVCNQMQAELDDAKNKNSQLALFIHLAFFAGLKMSYHVVGLAKW